MHKIVIVVPCYNEARRLVADRFVEHCREHPNVAFVFVDDGSTDDTFEVLSALAARSPEQLSVLKLSANSGKAEAVRRGVLAAFEASPDAIGYWDADLSTPLDHIELLEAKLTDVRVQLVVGSRVKLLGRNIQRKAVRHYLGRAFATLAAFSLQLPIYDTQCGAKLFRANNELRAVFREPFELGWSFDVELIARLLRGARLAGLDPNRQIVEVPLDEWIDAPGSKVRPGHFPRIALEMCKLLWVARRG